MSILFSNILTWLIFNKTVKSFAKIPILFPYIHITERVNMK